jgi:hypothetical protein
MTIGGLALLAEASGGSGNSTPPAWVFGLGAFLILSSLMFIVTRMNIKR